MGASRRFLYIRLCIFGSYRWIPKRRDSYQFSQDGFWQSTIENNTTNPDAGGIGWINYSSGRLLNVQTFLSSGTYTPTPGAKSVVVEMVGGGGGSDAAPATGAGQVSIVSGGGAGSYAKGRFSINFTSISIVVGAGGQEAPQHLRLALLVVQAHLDR